MAEPTIQPPKAPTIQTLSRRRAQAALNQRARPGSLPTSNVFTHLRHPVFTATEMPVRLCCIRLLEEPPPCIYVYCIMYSMRSKWCMHINTLVCSCLPKYGQIRYCRRLSIRNIFQQLEPSSGSIKCLEAYKN